MTKLVESDVTVMVQNCVGRLHSARSLSVTGERVLAIKYSLSTFLGKHVFLSAKSCGKTDMDNIYDNDLSHWPYYYELCFWAYDSVYNKLDLKGCTTIQFILEHWHNRGYIHDQKLGFKRFFGGVPSFYYLSRVTDYPHLHVPFLSVYINDAGSIIHIAHHRLGLVA